MFMLRARLLIATLWVGSLWTVGYLVAPTLFATLPEKRLAGAIAGSMFRAEAWLSMACAVALLILIKTASSDDTAWRRTSFRLVAGMLGCTVIGYFGLQPLIAVLRETAGMGGVSGSNGITQFAVLHGVASAIYLIESLLGLALILRIR